MAMVIVDKILECDDGKFKDRKKDIDGIVIHRIKVGEVSAATEIANFYREHTQYTGGQMPYTFVILPGGIVEQAIELKNIGPHARRWSSNTVGIGVWGNFTQYPPTRAQWYALIDLCKMLSNWLRKIKIFRHDLLPGGSSDPNKQCPGKFLNVEDLQDAVSRDIREDAARALLDIGVKF